jgi:hypothetical protein
VPYDFDAFTVIGASKTDIETVYSDNQRLLVERYQRCVYVVGANPASTRDQPVVTISQWWANGSTVQPVLIDQVGSLTLSHSSSMPHKHNS